MIDKQTAKEIALSCGFKLKEQENGEMDLNEYVYTAFNKVAEHCWSAWQSGVMPHKIHPTKASLNNGWISVDDELPKQNGFYLVCYDREFNDGFYLKKIDVVEFCQAINKFNFYHDFITHWQPLPQPPKEK